ncbi:uncharacterized protein C7orf50-like [Macrobrachium nipponense]|uniref:uncharacterized protein C7orf50-like n=1 Tax=Macrobrachium nipponense TaxID=159736 RepID=UPI0030C8792D
MSSSKSSNKKRRPKKKKSIPNTEYPKKIVEVAENKKEKVYEYLSEWHSNRSSWKYKKLYEIWLVKNFLKKPMLGKQYFKIFLLYVENMKGFSKQRCLEKVQAIVSSNESRSETDESPKERSIKLKRAKAVLRVLQEVCPFSSCAQTISIYEMSVLQPLDAHITKSSYDLLTLLCMLITSSNHLFSLSVLMFLLQSSIGLIHPS